MKRFIILIALSFLLLPLRAQEVPEKRIQFNVTGDYKQVHYPDGKSPSLGYSASFEYVNKHLLLGGGFDNGVRTSSMELYNTFLSAKAGYVFHTGRFHITPFIRTGWFMDVRKIEGTNRLNGYHQLLSGGGVQCTWIAFPCVWLTASAQFLSTSLAGNGYSAGFGIMIPLYDFYEKSR